MKRVLVDINVLLDVLLERAPHFAASAAVWAAIENGSAEGLLAAHAVTTVYYLMRKTSGESKARRSLAAILRVFGIAPVDGPVIRDALQLAGSDFEDLVTSAAARHAGCDWIVTRDPKGFRNSPVRALTAGAAAPLLTSKPH